MNRTKKITNDVIKNNKKSRLLKSILLLLVLTGFNSYGKESEDEKNIYSFLNFNFLKKGGLSKDIDSTYSLPKPPTEPELPEPPTEPDLPKPPLPEPPEKPTPILGNTYILNNNTGLNTYESNEDINVSGTIDSKNTLIGLAGNTSVATITNNKNINVSGSNSIGMGAYNGATSTNNGTIVVNGTIGMFSDNSTLNHNGEIALKTDGSIGVVANNESDVNLVSGKISANSSSNIGIQGSSSTITLDTGSEISLLGENNSGIVVQNKSTVINEGNITIQGDNGKGISQFADSMGHGTYINKGTISMKGANSIGVGLNNGSIFENSGSLEISGNRTYAVSAYNSTGTNKGIIKTRDGELGDNSIGYLMAVGTFENTSEGSININGTTAKGISLNTINESEWSYNEYTGSIINNGNIEVTGDSITLESLNLGASGISSVKGFVNNSSTGNIKTTGKNSAGISGSSNSITNDGTIIAIGTEATGIYSDIKTIIYPEILEKTTTSPNESIELSDSFIFSSFIENSGNINVQGESSIGINSNGVTLDNGLKVFNKINNSGNISVTGEGTGDLYGVKAINSLITNSGTIEVTNESSIGGNSFGISASNSYIHNTIDGEINVTGTTAIGIDAKDGSFVKNEGSININTLGTGNGVGIKVDGTSSFVNTGTITIDGINGPNSEDESTKDEDQFLTENNGTYNPIKLAENSTFINEGTLDYGSNTLDTNGLGKGKLVLENNGKIIAKELSGDIYVGFKKTMGTLDDKYIMEDALQSEILSGNAVSNSYLFSANIENTENDDKYDIILDRKNFQSITKNSSFGEYLETNYIGSSNENKVEFFDILKKNSASEASYDNFVSNVSGENFYSNVLSQSLDIYSNNRNLLLNSIGNLNFDLKKEYIIGYDFTRVDKESSNGQLGYQDKVNNVMIGLSNKIDSNLNIGYAFNYSNLDSDYQNRSSRADNFYELGLFLHKKSHSNLNYIGGIHLGYGNGDISRDLNIIGYNKSLESNIKNKYIGFTNQIFKEYTFNNISIKPMIEFNMDNINQYGIDEGNELFSIKLENHRTHNFKLGTGTEVNYSKNINNYNLNLSLLGAIYRNIHKSQNYDASINGLSNTYKIDAFNLDTVSGNIKSKLSARKNNTEFYISYDYEFNKQNSWNISTGFNYKF